MSMTSPASPSGAPPAPAVFAPIVHHVLAAPKEGNSDEQYEDGHAVSSLDGEHFTVALSDGASSAIFAREWAALLSGAWVENGFPLSDADAGATVARLAQTWLAQVQDRATSWHAQEKLQSGSAATLLVVTWDRTAHTWSASALGDVCVFLVRKNRLRFAFPLTKSTKFDDRPTLVSTRMGSQLSLPATVRYTEAYEDGDRFLLMTDALSQWFLSEYEAKRKPWNQLPTDEVAFTALLKTERDAGRLKNDDVTLLEVTL